MKLTSGLKAGRALKSRSGITMVEVLVALTVIGILLAIIIPAVQQARESSRRAHCQNNLRQIALAMEQFDSVYGKYPYSQLFGEHGIGPDSTAWSFLTQLLPYLEQNNLFTEGDVPSKTLRESGIADVKIPIFLCPSDPVSNRGPRLDAGNMVGLNFAVGQTNYKGVCGANWGADDTQGWSPEDSGTRWANIGTNGSYDGLNHGDGMLGRADYKLPRRKQFVIDGLSNTFMLGEALPKYDIYCSWPYANNVHSTCAIPPNVKDETDPSEWSNAQSFRSEHSGGLFFAMGDGSVRFINESIDLTLYRELATIAGREVVSLP